MALRAGRGMASLARAATAAATRGMASPVLARPAAPVAVAAAGCVSPAVATHGWMQPPRHARASCAHCVANMMGVELGAAHTHGASGGGGGGGVDTSTDYAFEMAASNIRFGAGVTQEVGFDFKTLGAKNVMVCTDKGLLGTPAMANAIAGLERAGVKYDVYDSVRVEPSDASLQHAIDYAKAGGYDAFLAVGGGSAMDTCKAANLYSSYPEAAFLDFVNAPVGKGLPVPGPVKPLIAIPTTSGTGSETTGVSIFDYKPLGAKTGIASRLIRPLLGVVDPDNMISAPRQVTVAAGFDVLSHAIESYTAVPFNQRSPRPETPELRPAYQGSNPISDVWCLHAMRLMAKYFVRSVKDPGDAEAREMMALAATYAGVGFGNAGVHLPHGMSYAVSGLNKSYYHDGYPDDHPLVPHGISVILNAPSVFRFTGSACPHRHLEAAEALGVDVSSAPVDGAGDILADHIASWMEELDVPNGLSAIGYDASHVPALVEGTLPQHRVIKLAPRPVGSEELTELFQGAMLY